MTTVFADNPRIRQLRRLHAIGRKRGFDHDALRSACCVASLTELTAAELKALADHLDQPAPHPTPRLCNTLHGDASKTQRDAIYAKLKQLQEQCGWPAEKCAGWLQRRYGLESPYADGLETGQASDILSALDIVLEKETTKATRQRGTQPRAAVPH